MDDFDRTLASLCALGLAERLPGVAGEPARYTLKTGLSGPSEPSGHARTYFPPPERPIAAPTRKARFRR